MNPNEINQALHEALGKYWFKHCPQENPDYCGDPRLVIEAMQERDDWFDFVQYICPIDNKPAWSAILDLLDLIMDKSGKLAMLAIEWMKEAKDE
jgi:hypothetical protein